MNENKIFALIFAFYLSGAVLTYGHAFVNLSAKQPIDLVVLGSAASAFLWPLYLSVQFWK